MAACCYPRYSPSLVGVHVSNFERADCSRAARLRSGDHFSARIFVCADVFGRAIFNSPVKGTPEIVSMSIVIICFLLAGYSVQSGGMIYTDVVSGMFGLRGLAFAQLLSAVLGIVFFGIIVGQLRAHTACHRQRRIRRGRRAARAGLAGARHRGDRRCTGGRELHLHAAGAAALITGRAEEVIAPTAATRLKESRHARPYRHDRHRSRCAWSRVRGRSYRDRPRSHGGARHLSHDRRHRGGGTSSPIPPTKHCAIMCSPSSRCSC